MLEKGEREKIEWKQYFGYWEKRSVSLVAHAHPVPCVEGVVSRVPVEGHLGTLGFKDI
jgi:hypothetical protein